MLTLFLTSCDVVSLYLLHGQTIGNSNTYLQPSKSRVIRITGNRTASLGPSHSYYVETYFLPIVLSCSDLGVSCDANLIFITHNFCPIVRKPVRRADYILQCVLILSYAIDKCCSCDKSQWSSQNKYSSFY